MDILIKYNYKLRNISKQNEPQPGKNGAGLAIIFVEKSNSIKTRGADP